MSKGQTEDIQRISANPKAWLRSNPEPPVASRTVLPWTLSSVTYQKVLSPLVTVGFPDHLAVLTTVQVAAL
ncbi:hypothetical protein E2C01_031055 [Portunus trituberculatus]|uniref:Uncharacterized protein n=1 Tax=Portunus trituberculatus TaxID=210409 RepID=A0A5B7EX31_PORTR|nr:hypothetical protein [Portunus trituberculatus]